MAYKMKNNKKTFDFGNKGSFDIKSKKPSKFVNLTTAKHGEYSYDPETMAIRKSEGTIAKQHQRRLKNEMKKK